MAWGLVAVALGMLYGYFSTGRQDKSEMLKTGVVWGVIIAVVFGVLGALLRTNPLGLGESVLASFISIVFTLLLFLLGVWLGDLLEARRQDRSPRVRV